MNHGFAERMAAGRQRALEARNNGGGTTIRRKLDPSLRNDRTECPMLSFGGAILRWRLDWSHRKAEAAFRIWEAYQETINGEYRTGPQWLREIPF